MLKQFFCKERFVGQNISIRQNVQTIFRCSDVLEVLVADFIRY